MGQPKTTLSEKKEARLRTLTDEAIVTIRAKSIGFFTRGWLSQTLGIDKDEAAPVISQLKKESVIEHRTTNCGDFADPDNRGKYFIVKERSSNSAWAAGKSKKPW